MSRLVVVSNRVQDPRSAAQAGGLAVAVADLLHRRGGLWFGWDGKVKARAVDDGVALATEDGVSSATVSLTRAEHDGYYLGYANSVLWPVFHGRLDLADFNAGFFDCYRGVNLRIAEHLAELIEPDDVIWVHDYHLIPLAFHLRERGVHNPIGFFLHTPFPPGQTFMAIPEHRQLARAFASYDLIGLQTKGDVANFLDYLSRSALGRLLGSGSIVAFDQRLAIGSFPIGIDTEAFAAAAASPEAAAQIARLRQRTAATYNIIGVDRLDYSKGLPERFRAFERFLHKYPQYAQEVSLTQVAPPTREQMQAYAEIRDELERLAGAVNGEFSDFGWLPIRYMHRPIPRERLPGIYRFSKVGLVTPLRDGMNLVAKEYIAAQDPEDPGVLVLSKFAGAAEELAEALIINPYNIEQVADAIYQALAMGREERIERQAALMERLRRNNVHHWSASFLHSLENVAAQTRAAQPLAYERRDERRTPRTTDTPETRAAS